MENSSNKKWTWDRKIQEDRQKLVDDPRMKTLCHECVDSREDEGASVTTVLNCAIEVVKNTKNLDESDVLNDFLKMNKTNQRLVVRKILHTKVKTGEYILVETSSKYRTGKKSTTKNYVVASLKKAVSV